MAAEAFKEFWTVYSDVEKPREGWPAGLVRCLACAGQPTDRTEGDSMNMLLPSSSPTLVDDASDESGKQMTLSQDDTYE